MKKRIKYALLAAVLIVGSVMSLGAFADISKAVNIIGDYFNDPINFLLIMASFVGLFSFFSKFISDACHWFSTGLTVSTKKAK